MPAYAGDRDPVSTTDASNRNWNYAYDDQNRLAAVCADPPCAAPGLSWSYDRYGNRWGRTANPGGEALGPQLAFHGTANLMDGFTYDAAGNLVDDGAHTYRYDAEGRVVATDNGAATYLYSPEGGRIHENVGGVVKEFLRPPGGQTEIVVDGQQRVLELDLYLDGRPLAVETPSGLFLDARDALGTVRGYMDQQGNWIEGYTSSADGADLNAFGAISPRHFTGKERDGESGLDYFGARYYNPNLGRFLTPDWSSAPEPVPYADLSNPQSLNLYSYALNNPVATDPDGHFGDGDCKGQYPCQVKAPADAAPLLGPDQIYELLQFARSVAGGVQSVARRINNSIEAHQSEFNLVLAVSGPGEIEAGSELAEARSLIKEGGGRIERVEPGHAPPNPHSYMHINYTTAAGIKGTIRIGGGE